MTKRIAFAASMVLSSLLLISSCSLVGSESDLSKLEGKWEWVSSKGGVMGHTITPDSTGYDEQRLEFYWDEEFLFYRADTLHSRGQYSFKRLEDNQLHLKYSYTTNNNESISNQIVEFPDGDTLIMIDQCTDCYTHTYARLPNN
ncbi:MAG: hypothetical protein ACQETE_07115 [Bacteroidota bacterium]